MQKEMNDILAFHRRFDVPIAVSMTTACTMPPLLRTAISAYIQQLRGTNMLGDHRLSLVLEECLELATAIQHGHVLEMYDALLDLMYVEHGTAVMFGITGDQMERGWDEIHRVNMLKIKVDGVRKIQHQPNYTPPNLQRCLDET